LTMMRKGKMVKVGKIEAALKKYQPKNMQEAFRLLDDLKFGLSNQEANEIVHAWWAEQVCLMRHDKGVLATPSVCEVA